MTNAACWIRTVLLPRQCILWSSNDLSCAFYLLRMPSIWRQFFALRRRVRTEWVGLPPGGYTYVTCDVVPMGWLSAVEIFQEFHRALVLKKQPLGAGLPRSLEWSRIDGGPNIQLLRKWFQIYVDDFDLAELIEIELVEKLLHTKSDLQKEVEAAYQRGHIAFSPEKTNSRLIYLERLGALVDGAEGMIGTTRERRVKLLALWCHLLSQEVAPRNTQSSTGACVSVCFSGTVQGR